MGENCEIYNNLNQNKEEEKYAKLLKVKSPFILKKIFSFLEESKQVNVTMYNKHFFKILGIDLEYIEIISGKYLISEQNGYGKEYILNSNKLIFEGEYINGKRNGKGKEYYPDGKLEFEGEFLNGKNWEGKGYDKNNNIVYELKNGKGFIKKYYDNICLKFEGEYLKGEKNGKGKEYHLFTEILKFEGEYLNGKRNGKGKEYNENGKLIFEGEFKNNYRSKGKEFVYGMLEFEGEYLFNKKWNGKGYDEEGNIICEFKNGNGKVKEYDDYGHLEFKGEYLNGIKFPN